MCFDDKLGNFRHNFRILLAKELSNLLVKVVTCLAQTFRQNTDIAADFYKVVIKRISGLTVSFHGSANFTLQSQGGVK